MCSAAYSSTSLTAWSSTRTRLMRGRPVFWQPRSTRAPPIFALPRTVRLDNLLEASALRRAGLTVALGSGSRAGRPRGGGDRGVRGRPTTLPRAVRALGATSMVAVRDRLLRRRRQLRGARRADAHPTRLGIRAPLPRRVQRRRPARTVPARRPRLRRSAATGDPGRRRAPAHRVAAPRLLGGPRLPGRNPGGQGARRFPARSRRSNTLRRARRCRARAREQPRRRTPS